MQTSTADPNASSHAGDFGSFTVSWPEWSEGTNQIGWYLTVEGCTGHFGPYVTSQAAFGAAKDAIDNLIKGGEI